MKPLKLALCLACAAWAQGPPGGPVRSLGSAAMPPDQLPAALRDIGIDQKLGQPVSLDLPFRDESGRVVRLSEFFRTRPVVLALVYYDCPMLCHMVLNGLLRGLRAVPLNAGRDFDVVAVSIDPREGPELAGTRRRSYVEKYNRAGAESGWHFLTGDEPSIQQLAREAGFRYAWDEKAKQYTHAAGVMILTPDGRLARYFYGVEYSARDLKLGLIEASARRIGSPVDRILLYCFHYDPSTGRYGVAILNVIRTAGLATALALAGMILVLRRRERPPRS